MPSKRLSFTLNPQWPHIVSLTSVALALLLGLFRYLVIDRTDPLHCDALLTQGRWLDSKFKNWQPEGCMMHSYQAADVSSCLGSRELVFIGDSVTRQLFFQTAHIVDSSLPTAPPDDEHRHRNHSLTARSGVRLLFFWDPYLNASATEDYLQGSVDSATPMGAARADRPAMLVLGSGLWYLRYPGSGGLPAWEAKMETTLETLAHARVSPADEVIILPVEDPVTSKLSRDRAASMLPSDIDAMNSDLLHRIRPPAASDPFTFFPNPRHGQMTSAPVSLPVVFNKMLEPSQTEDGLHFSDAVVATQANILLNRRCNDVLPKAFPIDKTCCRRYPWPTPLHSVVLAAALLWGPVCVLLSRRVGPRALGQPFIGEHEMPAVVISAATAVIYFADRSGFWLKEQKQFNPWVFGALCLLSLAVGLATTKRAEQDLGFLNRDQTDEWKGWMQIAILIYHYFGASKISGIYNPIRVLVAAYLFMTGYGHTMFYVKKADFGFLRIAQVLVRLNLFTLVLAYAMNTDYIFYYFSPLVSWWFLIIYVTMVAGSQYNDHIIFLVAKILVSLALVTWFMSEPYLLEKAFQFLERVCNIHWSAREWTFRVNLDLWIVYFGMFCALAVIKAREYRITDDPRWPLVLKCSVGLSVAAMLWFFAFELSQPDKFTYNHWHPYIAFLPIGAFVVLRNANVILRSAHSRVFAFIGKCSLETFIIQYHLWLAGDTKGILIVYPRTRSRGLNIIITTAMFIYVSHRVAQATNEITKWICDTPKPAALPTTADGAPASSSGGARRHGPEQNEEGQEVIFMAPPDGEPMKDDQGNALPVEPDTPARPERRRWVDRLAEGSSPTQTPAAAPGFRVWYGETEWKPGVKSKIAIGFAVMWLLNVMWTNPS